MSTMEIIDYLTREINIDRNLVTYRALSRELSIHVNTAKNELAAFYASSRGSKAKVLATYLVSGIVKLQPPTTQDLYMMDDDEDEDLEEYVMKSKVLLVSEDELEDCESQFETITSKHIYSLSPSRIYDAGLLCTATDRVRSLDAQKGLDFVISVGKVIGAHVTRGKKAKAQKPLGSTSKGNKQPSVAPTVSKDKKEPSTNKILPKPAAVEKKAPALPVKAKEPVKSAAPLEKKASATLDWSNAKPKGTHEAKVAEAKKEAKKKEKATTIKAEIMEDVEMDTESTEPKPEAPKRGVKRKSETMTTDDPPPSTHKAGTSKPSTSGGTKLRRNVVLSDDEEDEVPEKKAPRRISKGKNRALLDSDDEDGGAHALMDIDDDQVIKATSSKRNVGEEEEEEQEQEQVDEMDVDEVEDIKPIPRKRREKKVIPVGRNGLKKKRIVKQRTALDAKGFTVFEDYSEYESVDEEQPEEDPKASKKGKASAATSATAKSKVEFGAAKGAPAKVEAKPKKSTNGSGGGNKANPKAKSGQQSMTNFFGKKSS